MMYRVRHGRLTMSQTDDNFKDESLRAALKREADRDLSRRAPAALRGSIDALFAQQGELTLVKTPVDPARARQRWRAWAGVAGALAAAVLVGVMSMWQLNTNSAPAPVAEHHDEEDEYLVPEDKLWSALATLARATSDESPAATLDAARLAREIGAPAVAVFRPDSGWTLKAWTKREFLGVPAAVLRYERAGQRITLVSSPASKLLKNPAEEEPYNELADGVRLAGGNRNGVWTCALAEAAHDPQRLATLLDLTTPVAASK
jgi:hypothetical protein